MPILDGLLYVGTELPTPDGRNDPCLVDPSLPVASYGNFAMRQMGYWPSYSDIPSSARRAYLEWLAGGRRDPAADIGYVFLYFYGLERRAILDAALHEEARAEWPVIAEELRRLLGIYGATSGSFRNYAGSLLDWVSLADHPEKAYAKPVPSFPRTHELPLYIRVALGQAAVDGAPVPPALALAWVRLDPTIALRTPASRCSEEFDKLFIDEYSRTFGEGMILPRNRTKLKLVHRPASSGFMGYGEVALSFGDIPDITALTAPIKKLQQTADAATTKLDQFSRYVGKNPDARQTFEGALLLPAALWPDNLRVALEGLRARMEDGVLVVPIREVLSTLHATGELNRSRSMALARALGSVNIGMEPDVLGGARTPKPDDAVALFTVAATDETSRATPAYQAAMLTVQLAAAVAGADGEFDAKELDHVKSQIRSWSHLTPNHIRRLNAHAELLVTAPVPLSAIKRKLDPIGHAAKETIARFMATVAQADGMVSPDEVRMLERVYKALGIEPDRVFTNIHAAAVGSGPTATPEARRREGFRLDPDRIAALQQDTAAVSALLAGIFQEEEMSPAVTREPEAEEEAVGVSPSLLGLDEPHSAFARLLMSRPAWGAEELADAAMDLDLMLAGALEALNEAAFDLHDLPFTEGEDPVTINPDLVERLAE